MEYEHLVCMSANIETLIFPTPLDESAGLPLRIQLRERLLSAIGSGILKPGDRLPTMRALSVHLRIDLNTVQRAYAELERLGTVETYRARGSFVSNAPPTPDPAERRAATENLAAATIAQSHARGLDPADIINAMQTILHATEAIRPGKG